jgi:hypothetical protein
MFVEEERCVGHIYVKDNSVILIDDACKCLSLAGSWRCCQQLHWILQEQGMQKDKSELRFQMLDQGGAFKIKSQVY